MILGEQKQAYLKEKRKFWQKVKDFSAKNKEILNK